MTLLLVWAVSLPPAVAGGCHWKGEAVDLFTHQDGRYLEGQMILAPGATSVAGLNIHHARGDAVQVDLGFDEPGATDRMVEATLQFLLTDGTVVGLHLVESTVPTSNMSLFGHGIYTAHVTTGVLPLPDALRLADGGGIAQLRHDLLASGTVTRKVDPAQSRALVSAMVCASGKEE